MRWTLAPKPNRGDIIYKKKFAWFPVIVLNSGIWLESYYIKYKYVQLYTNAYPNKFKLEFVETTFEKEK